jgi:homoserine O-succinyltransferase
MLLSCLSAHAALTVFDGIARQRLTSKCTGVFPQVVVDPAHPLTAGLEPRITLPHSRTSTVAEEHLRRRRRLSHRGAVRRGRLEPWPPGRSAWPRSCSSRATPSTTPPACCGSTTATSGATSSTSATSCRSCRCTAWPRGLGRTGTPARGDRRGQRDPALVEAYPFDEVGARAPWSWHGMAQRLYANWLAGFSKRSD